MKKIFSFSILLSLLVALISISGCSFSGLTVDEAKTNLTEAGYEVRVMNGGEYLDSDENEFQTIIEAELDYYLYATKGEDKIYMFFFVSTDVASNNYSFMNMDGLRSGQNNSVVYFGTKQAIKDSKI